MSNVFPPRGNAAASLQYVFGAGGRGGDNAIASYLLSTAGVTTVTAPPFATKARLIVVGGGGGGAGGKITATDILEAGAGGGGGGYAEVMLSITGGNSFTCTVGAG